MALLDVLRRLLGYAPPTTGDLERKVVGAEKPAPPPRTHDDLSDIEVIEEYRLVEQLLAAKVPVIFVTGGAGTGKSVLIRYLRNSLSGNVVVLAPTGVAALNVGGSTIHSFFQFPPRVLTSDDIKQSSRRALYQQVDVLIIDEVSMVRADLLDAIDEFLRLNGRDPMQPFGGAQLVLVGDLLQLPPVVNRSEEEALRDRYRTPFFFSASGLANEIMGPIELTRAFRQRNPVFSELLNRIRIGEPTDDDLAALNSRVTNNPAPDAVVLTPTNKRADEINSAHLRTLPGAESLYEGRLEGRASLQDDKLPSPKKLYLKPGARVMFTKNDPDKRWVNGSLGQVIELGHGRVMVSLDDSARKVEVCPGSWEAFRYEWSDLEQRIVPVVAYSYTQLPLMLSWAITVHKSQGKTLDSIHLDLGRSVFAGGQTYVGLSRVRRLEDLSLTRSIRRADIFVDLRVKRFYEGLFARPE